MDALWCLVSTQPARLPRKILPPLLRLFALLHPILNGFPRLANLLLQHGGAHLTVGNTRLHEPGHAFLGPEMVLGNDRVALLIGPDQVADIPGGEGEDSVRGDDTDGDGHGAAEEDVPVASDNAAGHSRDQHIDGTRHDLLARLLGGSQRRNGAGEGVLEAQGLGQSIVDFVLGLGGVSMEEKTGLGNLSGQTVGIGGSRRLRGGLGWADGLGGHRDEVVVDGLVAEVLADISRAQLQVIRWRTLSNGLSDVWGASARTLRSG